jgi:hypothetical protein
MNQRELKTIIGYYWRYENRVKNFGDMVGSVILRYLGFHYKPVDLFAENIQDRPVLTIGSILSSDTRLTYDGRQEFDIWGCGIRHVVDEAKLFARCRFLAVRGELTIAVLGLAKNIATGDPGLLLPRFYSPQVSKEFSGQVLLVPHFTRDEVYAGRIQPRNFGCTRTLSTRILLTQGEKDWLGYAAPEYNQNLDPCDMLPLMNGSDMGFFGLVDAICSSRFVLTGSLHCAIIAHAYGIPWAPLNDGYINLPAKWLDFGSSIGVRAGFCPNAAEGVGWWKQNARHSREVDAERLIDVFLECRG